MLKFDCEYLGNYSVRSVPNLTPNNLKRFRLCTDAQYPQSLFLETISRKKFISFRRNALRYNFDPCVTTDMTLRHTK